MTCKPQTNFAHIFGDTIRRKRRMKPALRKTAILVKDGRWRWRARDNREFIDWPRGGSEYRCMLKYQFCLRNCKLYS